MIIGLTGPKGSGKTTVAKYLCSQYNFVPLSFSTKIKQVAKMIYNLNEEQVNGSLKEVIDERYNITPRFILQKLGTEICREIYSDTWIIPIKNYMDEYPNSNYVIDDVRYDNEANLIKSYGGEIWLIDRSELNKIKDLHSSESGITVPPDNIIINIITLDGIRNLHQMIKNLMFYKMKNIDIQRQLVP